MIVTVLLLIIGFALLIKGADFFVSGASAIGVKLGIPQVVIGLTLVAIGTSLPELFVNVAGSFSGKNDIVLGNIVGSNLFNGLFILGIASVILPIKAEKNTIWKEIPFIILTSFLLFVLANDALLGAQKSVISRGDGLILFAFLAAFLYYLFSISKSEFEKGDSNSEGKVAVMLLKIGVGIAGLVLGGKLTVDAAVKVAQGLGVSEKLIALTIVSVGTSLPELVTSVVAAMKKNNAIALGNVVGSNIFNILLIIGTSALISPIQVVPQNYYVDFAVLIASGFILFISMFFIKKGTITRPEGVFLSLLYVLYIVYSVMRVG